MVITKILGDWTSTQIKYYKNKTMKINLHEIWTLFVTDPKYKKCLRNYEEKWNDNLIELKKYLDDHNKRPVRTDGNENNRTLSCWSTTQNSEYKNKTMKNEYISNWTLFINDPKYKKYFRNNVEEWNDNFILLKKYLDDHNKRPSKTCGDENNKILSFWLVTQNKNYKNKKNIMNDQNIYGDWKTFITS